VNARLDTSALELELVCATQADPEFIDQIELTPQDLYDSRAGQVFAAQLALRERGEPIDSLSLRLELERRNVLAAADENFLTKMLAHGVAVMSPLALRRLHEVTETRRLKQRLVQALALCEDGDPAVVRAAVEDLASVRDSRQRGESISIADAALGAINDVFQRGEDLRRTLGLPCLDASIGGIEPGNMLVIGADTSVGKSSFVLCMALGMAEHFPVGIVSCEDAKGVWGARAAAHWSGVSPLRMRTSPDGNEYARLGQLAEHMPAVPVHLEIQIGKTEAEVCAAMRRLVHRHGARVLFVDYIQTILSSHPNAPRRDQVRDMAARLKGQAATLGVPLVLVSQLSRPEQASEVREPSIFSLKETGDLENAAEVVLLLWRPDAKDTSVVSVKIGKAKWGARKRLFQFVRDHAGVLVEQPDARTQERTWRKAEADVDQEGSRS
jgi:replicative DNA helicase